MKISINKQILSLIAVLLLLATAVQMTALPTDAQTYYNSYVYVAVNNAKVGVGQQLIIITWSADMPPIGPGESQAFRGWLNMAVTITDPDNENTTVTIPLSDPIGSGYVPYVPEKVGTYTVVASIPQQIRNTSSTQQSIYSAAVSLPVTFEVQNDPMLARMDAPVPDDYWTRPIAQNLHSYYVLAGNWLGGAANQYPQGSAGQGSSLFSYSPGPGSAHILWTKPFWAGGIMDDRYDSFGFMQYQYQGLTWSAIVLDGKVHYVPRYTHASNQGWAIVDLYSGETLYENYTDALPSFGQVYNYESPNQHGGLPYLYRTVSVSDLPEVIRVANVRQLPDLTLQTISSASTINRTTTTNSFGTIWELIDGHTMKHVTHIANVSSGGTAVYGKDGSILRYSMSNLGTTESPRYYMTIWNSSAGTMVAGPNGTDAWQWRPAGGGGGGSATPWWGSSVSYNNVHNGALMYTGNFSIPSPYGPRNSLVNQTGTISGLIEGEYGLIATAGRNDERGVVPAYVVAFSLERGKEGTKLWDSTLTPPFASQAGNVSVSLTGVYSIDEDTVTVCYHSAKLLKRWGYDAKTGSLLWEVDVPQADYYGFNTNRYGNMLLSTGYGGILNAIDLRTGYVWNYTAANNYIGDSVFGNYPMNVGAMSNDGKIYIGTGQHSPGPILESGNVLQCINASNGALLWNFPVYGVSMPAGNAGNYFVIADGRLIALNAYDNQLYCFGKGPSATTVSASPDILMHGNSVMVKGTVTDQTASGRRNTNDKQDFSLKGTPAISDEDMNEWMQHLYQQAPAPENAKGVTVNLASIDPNGNYVSIGTTTSDMNGNYAIPYTPEVPGTYQIIATFEGTEAYGPSSSTAYITVKEQPAVTSAPTEAPQSIADMYFVPSVISIIIVIIAIGAIIILLLLKKRP
jgi:hypothetical protein